MTTTGGFTTRDGKSVLVTPEGDIVGSTTPEVYDRGSRFGSSSGARRLRRKLAQLDNTTATERALGMSLPPDLRNKPVSDVRFILEQRNLGYEPTPTEIELKQSLPADLRNKSPNEVKRIQRQQRFEGRERFQENGSELARRRSLETRQTIQGELPETGVRLSEREENVKGVFQSIFDPELSPQVNPELKEPYKSRAERISPLITPSNIALSGLALTNPANLLKGAGYFGSKTLGETAEKAVRGESEPGTVRSIAGSLTGSTITAVGSARTGSLAFAGVDFGFGVATNPKGTVQAVKEQPGETVASLVGFGAGARFGRVTPKVPEPKTLVGEVEPGKFVEVTEAGKGKSIGAGEFTQIEDFAFSKPGKKGSNVIIRTKPLEQTIKPGEVPQPRQFQFEIPKGKESLFEDILSRPKTDRFLLRKRSRSDSGRFSKRTAITDEFLLIAKEKGGQKTSTETAIGLQNIKIFDKKGKLKQTKTAIVEPEIDIIGSKFVPGGVDRIIKQQEEFILRRKTIKAQQQLDPFKEGTFEVQSTGLTTTEIGKKPKTTTGTGLFRRVEDQTDQFRIKSLKREPQTFSNVFEDISKGRFEQLQQPTVKKTVVSKPRSQTIPLFQDLPYPFQTRPKASVDTPLRLSTKTTTTPRTTFTGTPTLEQNMPLFDTGISFFGVKPMQQNKIKQPFTQPQQPLGKVIQEPIQKPIQELIQQPRQQPQQKPVSRTRQQPIQQIIQEPTQGIIEKPVLEIRQRVLQKPTGRPLTNPFTGTTTKLVPDFDKFDDEFFKVKKKGKKKKDDFFAFIPNIIGLESSLQTGERLKKEPKKKTFFGFEKRLLTEKPLSISPFTTGFKVIGKPGAMFKQPKQNKKKKLRFPF